IHQPCHAGKVLVGFGDGHQIVCVDDHIRHLLLLPVYAKSRRNTTYNVRWFLSKSKSPKRSATTMKTSFSGSTPGNSSAHCWRLARRWAFIFACGPSSAQS